MKSNCSGPQATRKIRFREGGLEVEFKPGVWGQFACRSHTQYGQPDGGLNSALHKASDGLIEQMVEAYNQRELS